jgi:hypothetical protein
MGGNPAFRGTRVPVHMLAKLVPSRACARTRYRRGSAHRQVAVSRQMFQEILSLIARLRALPAPA